MPTGYSYQSYQNAVVTQIPSLTDDPNFQTMLPDAIDYAELSIYRDLDFLALHGLISLGDLTIGSPLLAVASTVVVLEELFYQVGSRSAVPILPASQQYIRMVYDGATNGPPQCFSVIGAATGGNWTPGMQVLVGPAPDAAYPVTAYVTKRQAPLSATTTETFISQNLPDLFWASSMIFWSGYNRNFGAQTDDPRQAVSWSAEYQRLLHGADREEVRKKFLSQQATAQMPQARIGAEPPQPGAPA